MTIDYLRDSPHLTHSLTPTILDHYPIKSNINACLGRTNLKSDIVFDFFQTLDSYWCNKCVYYYFYCPYQMNKKFTKNIFYLWVKCVREASSSWCINHLSQLTIHTNLRPPSSVAAGQVRKMHQGCDGFEQIADSTWTCVTNNSLFRQFKVAVIYGIQHLIRHEIDIQIFRPAWQTLISWGK